MLLDQQNKSYGRSKMLHLTLGSGKRVGNIFLYDMQLTKLT